MAQSIERCTEKGEVPGAMPACDILVVDSDFALTVQFRKGKRMVLLFCLFDSHFRSSQK